MRNWFGVLVLFAAACASETSSDLRPRNGAASGGDDDDTSLSSSSSGGTSTASCAAKSYKLCEDFDSSTVGSTPTGFTVVDGYEDNAPTTVVASDAAHSGKNALKTSSAINGAARVQKSLAALGTTAGTHWGRIFFKVQSPAPQLSS